MVKATEMSLDHKIIYYEASRGCPFRCQYCLSSANSSVRFVPIDKVLQHMQYFLDQKVKQVKFVDRTFNACLLYTSDAADDLLCVDLGGRRIIKKKKTTKK